MDKITYKRTPLGGIEVFNNGNLVGGIYRIMRSSNYPTRMWTISIEGTKCENQFLQYTSFDKARRGFLKRLPDSPNL